MLARFDVPQPTLCPEERVRRRMLFANQRNLFIRNCDATGKRIVTYYPPDAEAVIYDIAYWWSDSWDQLATGRDFDFGRPFFEQFHQLMKAAPRPSMHRGFEFDENAEYTNYAGQNKDCYLIFDSDLCRDCYYSYSINSCVDCIDCFRCDSCELCYECVDCRNCYSSSYLQNSYSCSESWLLKNCIGCSNCIGCVNLKNKSYCYFNRQLSPVEYRGVLAELGLKSRAKIAELRGRFLEFSAKFPCRASEGLQNEDSIGSYLSNCKNAMFCFDSRDLWDCYHCHQAFGDCKDCLDCTEVGLQAELCYETAYSGFPANNFRFTSHSFPGGSDQTYCYFTPSSSSCFGCVGLHHKRYCILNKQYSAVDYAELLKKITDHMKTTGEWGEHFPPHLSPFEYNISVANDFYPLTREQALERGYRWREPDIKEYQSSSYKQPDTIEAVSDTVCKETLSCVECGKNYRIQSAELRFYRRQQLPIPHRCFEDRHTDRLMMRNPRQLYQTSCAVSGKTIYTSVAKAPGIKIISEEEFAELLE